MSVLQVFTSLFVRARHTVLALAGLLALTSIPAMAAPGTLTLFCGAPVQIMVTCRLAGHAFYPRERLHITYILSIGTTRGQRRTLIHRGALTDSYGAFTRPPLVFALDPAVLTYRLTATVAGARGEHTSSSAAGTP